MIEKHRQVINVTSEWVIKFNGLCQASDIVLHVVHIRCVIMTHTLSHYLPSPHDKQKDMRGSINIELYKNYPQSAPDAFYP